MIYTQFTINGFKGIKNVELKLNQSPNGNLIPLVGLNESGKTTVLEAINYFTYKTEDLLALKIDGYAVEDPRKIIPICKRHNFNDDVSLSFTISLDEADEEYIKSKIAKETGLYLEKNIEKIEITQKTSFTDSKYVGTKNVWGISLFGRSKKNAKPKELYFTKDKDLWLKCVKLISGKFPPILYFPNFMFEIPERIYLDKTTVKGSDEVNNFYWNVIQDILDAMQHGATVEKHILERIKSDDQNDKNNLNSLFLEIGKHVTKTVFGAWDKIFKRKADKKRVILDTGYDKDYGYYVQFRIEDEEEGSFLVNERSLGFRWFFVFLLLTHYRAARKDVRGKPLFLFDEPASNLHPSAQEQLLNIFREMGKECTIIYTTHSYHMISPEHLEKTIIVKNHGLENAVIPLSDGRSTDIKLYKYREFVSKFPDQLNYFKPLLDVLQFTPTSLELKPKTLMLEGKNDYYFYELLKRDVFKDELRHISFLPGTGSGNLILPVQLYLSWNYSFIILFDADTAGIKEKNRILETFGEILNKKTWTYADINPSFQDYGLEKIIGKKTMLQIIQEKNPLIKTCDKKIFWNAIQEKVILYEKLILPDDLIKKLSEIVHFIKGNM